MNVTGISDVISRDHQEILPQIVEKMYMIQCHSHSSSAEVELVGDNVCFGGMPIPNEDRTMWVVGDSKIHNHSERIVWNT